MPTNKLSPTKRDLHAISKNVFFADIGHAGDRATEGEIAFGFERGRHDHVSVRYRKYSDYIARNIWDFRIVQHIPANKAFADFYLSKRIDS